MDQNTSVEKCLTSHRSNLVFTNLFNAAASSQDTKVWSLRDMRNLLFPGNVPSMDDTGMKVLLKKAVDQGLLELAGAHYKVKGHAAKKPKKAAKGGKKSASKKKSPKKAPPKKAASKGKKKSVGKKRKASKKAKPEEPPKK